MEKKKILIAEICFKSLEAYQKDLREFECDPTATYNGSRVMELFNRIKPNLVIISSCLTSNNSLDLIKEMREIDLNVKIVMTGHYGTKKKEAIDAGANAFFHKPITREKLIKILEIS
jgi:DNA-binding NtrC family response regulator